MNHTASGRLLGIGRLAPVIVLGWITVAGGADWRQFRGTESTGTAPDSDLPTSWVKGEDGTGENVAWQANLPGRGVSGPIVVQGKVIVTASSGAKQDRLHVLAFDSQSGSLDWHRQFWATGRTLCHPTMAVAAPTPASDGQRVFAFFSSNDLVCLDISGKLLWFRGLTQEYPAAANDVGMASSPVVVGNTVVVQVENEGDSFAAGIDTTSGATLWRLDRQRNMNWTSPTVMRGNDSQHDVVLLQSPGRLTAHEPGTGKQVWEFIAPCSIIPSVVASADTVLLPSAGLTALRRNPGSQGVEKVWTDEKLAPNSSSPLVHDGFVYTISSAPVLTCANAKTGEIEWRLRLKGTFWATPVAAAGHLYCVSDDGLAQVVQLEKEGKIVAECAFGEGVYGSPAVSDGGIYFRSDAHLWKIAHP